MNETRFWRLIEGSKAGFDPSLKKGNQARQKERMRKALAELDLPELDGFLRLFEEKFVEAYRWDLWAAAYLMLDGCSHDDFIGFRYWLISMGCRVYEAALNDPDSLIHVANARGFERATFPEFGLLVGKFEGALVMNGQPRMDLIHAREPLGESWEEDDLPRLCPRLHEKFGE